MQMLPTFQQAALFWLRLGFISFGGPAGQIAIMREYLVEKYKWIEEERFNHALNYCMLLPGPEAQQLATYCGWILHGTKGGVVAGTLFVLPAALLLLLLSILYVCIGNSTWVLGMFNGLKPAVIALIFYSIYKSGRKSLTSFPLVIMCVLSFIAIGFWKVPFPFVIIFALVLGWTTRNKKHPLTTASSPPQLRKTKEVLAIGKKVLLFAVLWLIPVLGLSVYYGSNSYYVTLSLFFTQSALLTFGGAYAVLPYVAQVSVEKFAWLSPAQMMDGMALGETTPGPLIIILAFVGFMAGYNTHGKSLFCGTWSLILTVYFTFLPSFFFIFTGAPLIDKTRENLKIKHLLQFVTAAVTGVMLHLGIYLTTHAFRVEPKLQLFQLGWVAITFLILYKNKLSIGWWITISALAGIVCNFIIAP